MGETKNIHGWRAEELAKISLLKSEFNMVIDRYPTPMFDFFVTLTKMPRIKFAVEVKTTIRFEFQLRKQLANLRIYRDAGMINLPVMLFKMDEKKETGELDFLVVPSFRTHKLIIRNNFHFRELNQPNLKSKIDTIIKWYDLK